MDKSLVKREPLGNGFYVNVSHHHTFGTDAILLASFAAAKKSDKLLDIGTGCGIIPLIMLRNGDLKFAVGVDISEEACCLAEQTRQELDLTKFTVINSDINDLKGKKQSETYKKEKEIEAANLLKEKLSTLKVTIKEKAGEGGKLFGKVTGKEIAEELKKQHNVEIDKKKIVLPDGIKTAGTTNVTIKLYPNITGEIKVEVIAE